MAISKKKKTPAVYIQLDGTVSVIEKVKGKPNKLFEIDPKVVLELVIKAIKEGVDLLEISRFDKKLPNPRRKSVSRRDKPATA